MKLTEKQIETQILTWLNLQFNMTAIKLKTMGTYSLQRKTYLKNTGAYRSNGMSDILCLTQIQGIPVTLFIEVKQPKKKQTPSQLLFEIKVKRLGHFYGVCSSVEDAQKFVEWVTLEIKSVIKEILTNKKE